MTAAATTHGGTKPPVRTMTEREVVLRSVTVIAGVVIALTFLFGFGNVFNLALRLGVPAWVAPLVAPAVDLSILGLLLGTRHLALTGAPAEVLRPARRLLIFASVVTLALNVADPLVIGEYGRAAFDSVGPLLLIGWSEVGPGLLQAISTTGSSTISNGIDTPHAQGPVTSNNGEGREQPQVREEMRQSDRQVPGSDSLEVWLERARQEDAAHRGRTQKPISADALRTRLSVGSARARRLVEVIRAEYDTQNRTEPARDGTVPEARDAVA